MGYTWTGTQIRQYDDNDTTGGHVAGPHSALEMSLSTDVNVAANWTKYTSNLAMYRGLATVLMGSSTGGTATTTWTDQSAVFSWDNTKALQMVGTNNFLNWGVKVGAGSQATGRNGVHAFMGASTTVNNTTGRNMIYGGSLTVLGVGNFLTLQGDSLSEFIDCIIGTTGTGVNANVRVGTNSVPTGVIYNVDFWGNGSGAGASILSVFNPSSCERYTVGGSAAGAQFRLTNSTTFQSKDGRFFGTPSVADMVFASAVGTVDLVKPGWSGATRVSYAGTIPAGNFKEYWLFDVAVAGPGGVGALSGIPVTLTDSLGNVAVSTTTDSGGRVSFGSGLLANAVTVRDHVVTVGVYTVRDHGPFLRQINTGASANPAYESDTQYAMWPTETNGSFKDMTDPVTLRATGVTSVSPTPWEKCLLGDLG